MIDPHTLHLLTIISLHSGDVTSGIPNSLCFGFASSKRFQLDIVTLSVQGVVRKEFPRRNAKNWFEMPSLRISSLLAARCK